MVKELSIKDIEAIVHRDENRVMEAKETTGELVKGMQSGCAFLNTDGGWLFFKRPHSEPVNEKIASALFKGGEMEGWGRGIPDIYDLCKAAGMPEPEFDFVPNFVCLTIWFKTPITPYVNTPVNGQLNGYVNGYVNGDVNGDVRSLKGVLKEIYMIVYSNPGIKTLRVAEIRRKSESTVWKQLNELRKKGIIEYRGSDRSGGYYVV